MQDYAGYLIIRPKTLSSMTDDDSLDSSHLHSMEDWFVLKNCVVDMSRCDESCSNNKNNKVGIMYQWAKLWTSWRRLKCTYAAPIMQQLKVYDSNVPMHRR
jgi:hypothetical protein